MLGLTCDFSQGWTLTVLLSLLCVLGCFIIFLDDAYYLVFPRWLTRRHPFHLRENYSFMNGSLAFSSGCLLLTALYRLPPEAKAYLEQTDNNANLVLMLAFMGGVCVCGLFNVGLHVLTTESVVHCSHDGEHKLELVPYSDLAPDHEHHHSHGHHSHGLSHHEAHAEPEDEHVHGHSHSHADAPLAEAGELVPLLVRKKSLVHYLTGGPAQDEALLGECKGYSSAELCQYERTGKLHFCEVPQLRTESAKPDDHEESLSVDVHLLRDTHLQHLTNEHHHHHVNSPLSRLLLIGIQTILAITLHKLPEGFITYVTSETNPELGLSIFFSLLIHNYTEGFLMCLPLYYSLENTRWPKVKAVSILAFLGGFSQPLGAGVGYVFMRYYNMDDIDVGTLNHVFGVSMGVTAGFLTVIALSMYGSAVSFSGRPNQVMVWCLLGMATIGASSAYLAD